MNFLTRLKILPRWIIATLDSFILLQCALFGYLVRFNFELALIEQNDAFAGSFTFMVGGLLVMQNTRSYEGIVRHTGFRDGSNIFKTVIINFVLFLFLNFFHGNFLNDRFLLPTSVLIIASLSAMFMLIFYRLLVKELFVYLKNGITAREMKNGIIFGAGEAGIIAQEAIKRDSKSLFNTVAFLDDDPKRKGKTLMEKGFSEV
ncbi:hypothetical protein V8V91_04180 [Algoriphagus halophilus]|uniref:nucleoside-diphosphate sugar epimerase/dehydratase n=1 Tax=Algoriphagus halophilus TaxID=226505 RepID=UPI00358FEFF8